MSFSSILKDITDSVPGSRGSMIAGMDGIIVEEYVKVKGADMQTLSAEYGNIFKEIQRISGSLQMGGAREVSISSEDGELFIRTVNEDYFVALIMDSGSNRGKGRFKLRIAAWILQREL